MSLFLTKNRPRGYAALATAALASTAILGTGTAATAVPSPVGAVIEVSTAAEYVNALTAINFYDDQAHTIRITANFTLDAGETPPYEGDSDLTIDGGGFTVSGPGVRSVDGGSPYQYMFLAVLANESNGGAEAATPAITLEDLTIQDFVTTGAVVLDSEGAHTLTSVALRDNANDWSAPELGIEFFAGGVSTTGGLTVENSEFSGNDGFLAGALGSMVSGADASQPMTVSDSVFHDNSAAVGGALLSFGPLTVTGSQFSENVAESGGAIASTESAVISTSTFVDNLAMLLENPDMSEGEAHGGAILAGSVLTVASSTFSGNLAGSGGAIAHDTTFSGPNSAPEPPLLELVVSDSTFESNSALYGAGAIEVGNPNGNPQMSSASVDISNSTFDANTTETEGEYLSAGAIVFSPMDGYDVLVAQNTFSGNAGADAAHIAADLLPADSFVLGFNAFADADGPGCAVPSETVTVANFDSDGTCTDGWSGDSDLGDGLDAQLGDLADNGGDTQTLLPAAGSPLIDAIATEDGACFLDADQRGIERPQGPACDIGSVEVVPDVASEPVAFTVETPLGNIEALVYGATAVSDIVWTATADITSTPPAGLVLPLGIAGFDITVPNAGDSVRIELTLPMAVTQFWKVQDGTWSQVDGATVSGTSISYELTDGQAGDEDGTANAVIVDPIAPAIGAAFTG
ncbi:choice-of-anchor U domain-containing protein [Demequina aurantiaca]|uniref:choice-of-anchor U domain-containing protein n=1 Tax=Demequina aurantiaca TaxID=676200 RepID=UPI003D33859E